MRAQSLLHICAALIVAGGSGGCGWSRSIAVRSMIPILDQSMDGAFRDRDLKTAREAIPGNLILLRGLCESEPGNLKLRETTAQIYFSFANGFIEDEDPDRAVALYEEGIRLGREGLMRLSWFRKAEAGNPLPVPEALADMDAEDVPLVFWTLANWSGWIALRLTEPEAVAQLPRLQAYLERVVEVRPDFFLGMPQLLMGSLMTFRPRLFGGNPEEGKKHFDEAFRISGRRMLYFHVAYARYYCRQTLDEECFDQTLKEVEDAPPDLLPEYRLFNEVAKAKARHLQEIRDELF